MIKYILGTVLAILALVYINRIDYYKDIGPSTVKITDPTNGSSGGTGFAVQAASGATYIMSNAHVCQVEKDGYVKLQQDTLSMRGRIVAVSEHTDLCLIQASPKFKGLKLAAYYFVGEDVAVLGHPWLNPLTLAQGKLRGRGIEMISYCANTKALFRTMEFGDFDRLNCLRGVESLISDVPVFPGNSGSAVVNTEGAVVGVVFAGGFSMGFDGIAFTSLFIPLDRVREFLSDY